MEIVGYIWREDVIDKLAWKHQVQLEEVEGVFQNEPQIERVEKGHRPGEDLYIASGQTDGGRYLIILYLQKRGSGFDCDGERYDPEGAQTLWQKIKLLKTLCQRLSTPLKK